MERNDRIHPSDPGPDETPDDPIFPDDIKHDGVEDADISDGPHRSEKDR